MSHPNHESLLLHYLTDPKGDGNYELHLDAEQTRKLWDEIDTLQAKLDDRHSVRVARTEEMQIENGRLMAQLEKANGEFVTIAQELAEVRAALKSASERSVQFGCERDQAQRAAEALQQLVDSLRNDRLAQFMSAALTGMLSFGSTEGRDGQYLANEAHRIASASLKKFEGKIP